MSCKPFIFTANTSTVTVATNSNIPLGNVVRQECDKTVLNGDSIICAGGGRTYFVTANVTLAPTSGTDSTVAIKLFQDGQPVTGAVASEATDGQVSLNVNAIVRNNACTSSVLTVQNTGVVASVTNCAVTIRAM